MRKKHGCFARVQIGAAGSTTYLQINRLMKLSYLQRWTGREFKAIGPFAQFKI